MSSKTRTSLLSFTIIAVIVFSAFGTTTVYADGDPPPDVPVTETVDSPDEASPEATVAPSEEVSTEASESPDEAIAESTSTSEPTAEATSDAGEATAEATSVPEGSDPNSEAPAPEPAEEVVPVVDEAASTPDASILDEVPDNTTVTVLDANGESQPLATQEAADAVATSDPIWCPDGAAPVAGAGGCTGSFTSFTALLTELQNNPTLYQGAGTIYIEQGAYQGGETTIDFNAYDLSAIHNANLTVAGGWNTATSTVDSATPSTFNNTSFAIGASGNPWGGSLTISNISLNFSTGSNSTTGLTVHAQNDILLANVDVTNAQTGAGADLNAGGNVTVTGSNFSRNKTAGAVIRSGGNVSINSSSFSNPVDGRRQDTGLDVISAGSVSLSDVLANENRVAGAHIQASGGVSIGSSFFSGTKVIQGADFLGYGLQVITPSTIDLESVTASNNFLWGASLDGGGHISIANSVFDANSTASPGFIDDTGIFIHGGSTVSLDTVQANDNRLFGAMIDAVGSVSVNNSTFSNNRGVITTGGTTTYNGHGLQITSQSGISLTNITALNNMLFGAQLNSGGNVNIAFSNFSNTSTGSSANALGKGLEIVSTGNASLVDVVLSNNQTVGASIQASDVSLIDVTATNNGTDGVSVQTSCVELLGGDYSGNGGHGLNLGTSALDLVTPPLAGDIFPVNPASCALLLSGGNTASVGSSTSNVFTSLQIAPQQSGTGNLVPVSGASAGTDSNTTLNSFMTNLRTTTGGMQLSIFTGKYAYIYSSAGMQVVAFAPSSADIAMDGPYKAY